MPPEEAVKLYNRATDIVHRLFVPPSERFPAIEALAVIQNPTKADVLELRRLVISPMYLRRFVQTLPTTAWLRLPDVYDLFDPPSEPAYWPVFEAVAVLGQRDPVGVAAWLTDAYDRCKANAPQMAHLFRAATSGGHPAPEIACRILQRHGAIKTVRDQARWFLMGCEPDDPQVVEFADILLNFTEEGSWELEEVTELVVRGNRAGSRSGSRAPIHSHRLRTYRRKSSSRSVPGIRQETIFT